MPTATMRSTDAPSRTSVVVADAARIHKVQADLTRPETLSALPRALDAVVFSPTPDVRDADGYRRTYVDGARNLLAQITKTGARPRWLHISSTAVYAQNNGAWVDENTNPECGDDARAGKNIARASEDAAHFGGASAAVPAPTARTLPRALRRALLLESETVARASGLSCVVLRLAGIYGPGRTGMLRRARIGADAARFTNRIHVDDAAGAAAHLLQLRAPAPLYIGVDCAPVVKLEILGWLATQLKLEPPHIQEAAAHVAADARAAVEERAALASDPSARDVFAPRVSGKRCSNARLLASGYCFRFPDFRAGYGALLGAG